MSSPKKLPWSALLVARALASHSAFAVVLSALLYIVCFSGLVVVFNYELQRWEQPTAHEFRSVEPPAVQRAAEAALNSLERPTDHFYIQLPTEDRPRMVVTTDYGAQFSDSDGQLGLAENHPWTQFNLDLHYYLNIPGVVGLTIVGALGVVMLVLSITGVVAHPRIVRDAFLVRLGRRPRRTQTDLHNRLSVWTLPFQVSISLTGAMLGLMTLIAGLIAYLDYDGDIEAVFEPVFGEEPASDDRVMPLADIASALSYMQEHHEDLVPIYVLMHEPRTHGQHLQVLAEHPNRLIFGDYYNFNADGRFLGKVGMSDGAAGQQISASAYRLHFGSFGGTWVKCLYAVFGVALLYIIHSGMRVFFLRRAERGQPMPRLEKAWTGLVWGTVTAWLAAYLATTFFGLPSTVLAPVFWGLLAVIAVGSIFASNGQTLSLLLRLLTGSLGLVTVVTHWLASNGDTQALIIAGVSPVIALSSLFVLVHCAVQMRARAREKMGSPTVVPLE